MRLISARIENFGILSGEDYAFEPGLNTILEDNGSGKSTLAAFIRVMLYGFEEGSRDEFKNERRRYEPWQGGVYGGSLKFEAGGRTYILSRTFGQTARKDSFSLTDADTNLESRDFSSDTGAELFGLDGASFRRTVFISQNDCATAGTSVINAKLGGLAEMSGDMGRYDRAQDTLKDLMNKLNPDRKTGTIHRLKEETAGLERDLRSKEGIDRRLAEGEATLADAKRRESDLARSLGSLREKQDGADAVNDLLDRREKYDELKRSFDRRRADADKAAAALDGKNEADIEKIDRVLALCKERTALVSEAGKLRDRLAALEVSRSSRGPLIPLLAVGLAMLLAGLVIAGLGVAAGLICSAAGIAAAGAAFLPMLRSGGGSSGADGAAAELEKNEAEAEKLAERLRSYAEDMGLPSDLDTFPDALYGLRSSLEGRLSDLRHAGGELERAEKDLRDFEAVNDIDRLLSADPTERTDTRALVEEIRRVSGELDGARSEAGSLGRELDGLRAQRDELDAKDEELREKRELLGAEEKRFRIYGETQEMLRKARESLTARYMSPLKKGFDKYYSMLTGAGAGDFELDTDINLKVREAGLPRDIRFLSQGRRDLAGICHRMAMIDAMYPGEKPFIILDDPFTNLDAERTAGGLRFLKEAAKEYQIIYFTCHGSRA